MAKKKKKKLIYLRNKNVDLINKTSNFMMEIPKKNGSNLKIRRTYIRKKHKLQHPQPQFRWFDVLIWAGEQFKKRIERKKQRADP